jgi:putative endonuclease
LSILASKRNGTLYIGIGVTSDLPRSWHEHQVGLAGGFTGRYGVKRLVWYEEFPWMIDAIAREKQIKNWPRRWKLDLIEKVNQAGAISATISSCGEAAIPRLDAELRECSPHLVSSPRIAHGEKPCRDIRGPAQESGASAPFLKALRESHAGCRITRCGCAARGPA